jgi:hypothetical protein
MKKLLKHPALLIISIIFFLLLFKNPYSQRNLISNLSPFPDAQYYTTTPRCFLNGQSWKMCRLHNPEFKGIETAVPPAYSLIITPAYIINFDVRSFYFINLLLSFTSLLLLYKISNNFFKNKAITGVILLFYVTNYFIYWYPSLAMAENLFLPLFLTSILLLQNNTSKKNSFFVGFISACFYATKYAFAPLTLVFPFIYFLKIIFTKENFKDKVIHSSFVAIPAGLILFNLVGIKELFGVANEMSNGAMNSSSSSRVSSGGGYFSINYFSKHFNSYSKALLGKSEKFLWDNTPLVTKWIALPGLLGLLSSFKKSEFKFTKIYLIVAIIAQLLFISTFYVVDIRYVYHFLPTLLLGFGFFLQLLNKSFLKNKINFYAFITMILIIYLGSNILRLKSAIMVNLKYAETPWWYLSQVEMNKYFNEYQESSTKPSLISLASPFSVDNYSDQNYVVLPLDAQQDFRRAMSEVWGPNNYENLIKLYENKLLNNEEVFLTNYGINGAGYFQESYSEIEKNFVLTKVHTGCHNLCNIYQLSIKENIE